jgi:hypothetical protein
MLDRAWWLRGCCEPPCLKRLTLRRLLWILGSSRGVDIVGWLKWLLCEVATSRVGQVSMWRSLLACWLCRKFAGCRAIVPRVWRCVGADRFCIYWFQSGFVSVIDFKFVLFVWWRSYKYVVGSSRCYYSGIIVLN